MKKLVFITVCLVAFAISGFAQSEFSGEKGISSIGVIAGYAVDNKSLTIGADYRYNIMDNVRLAPSALYVLENDYVSRFYANADVHYLARITDEITLYPIGGLGISATKFGSYSGVHGDLEDAGYWPSYGSFYDFTKSETKIRVGLNLGFGGEVRVTKDIIVGAEFRYNLTTERAYDQAMLLARAAYYF
jgi:hypothetical protein